MIKLLIIFISVLFFMGCGAPGPTDNSPNSNQAPTKIDVLPYNFSINVFDEATSSYLFCGSYMVATLSKPGEKDIALAGGCNSLRSYNYISGDGYTLSIQKEGYETYTQNNINIPPSTIENGEVAPLTKMSVFMSPLNTTVAVDVQQTIDAKELFNDGHLNINELDTRRIKLGRLFENQLHHLTEFRDGDIVEFQMPYLRAYGVVDRSEIDAKGNNTVVLNFLLPASGYFLLYQSAGYSNGEIFIMGQHYDFVANSEIGVIVDMKIYAPWPVE